MGTPEIVLDKWVKAQEEYFSSRKFGTASRIPIEFFKGWLPEEGVKVLDVGCNDGGLVKKLLDTGHDCCGIDLPRVIDKAKKRYPELVDRLSTCNLEEEEIPGGPYDMILALGVMEHLLEWEKFMGKVARALNSYGVLFITTCNSRVREIEEWHSHHFTEEELLSLAESSGLEVLRFWQTSATSLLGTFRRKT